MEKLNVGIVGATGVIGQEFVESLFNHPWFEISSLYASRRTAGKKYADALKDRMYVNILPQEILEMEVYNIDDLASHKLDVCFSGLPSDIGKDVESKIAENIDLISTSAAFRYTPEVPILIPEVNPEHAEIIKFQKERRGWKSLTAISNCTTRTLVIPLKPIYDNWGIESLHMTSMQAKSGAGEKGIREDSEYRRFASKNLLPFIENEEPKVVKETKKILGKYENGKIIDASMKIYPTCTRVDVEDGHTESVSIKTKKACSVEEVKNAFKNFTGLPQKLDLPSAPEKPIIIYDEPTSGIYDTYRPQPRLDSEAGGGMITSVGRIRNVEDEISFVTCSHNTKIGGAKGAVLNAEYLLKKGFL